MDLKEITETLHAGEIRLVLLEQKVDQIDKNVAEIKGVFNKILLFSGLGVLSALLSWVLKGGLFSG